MHTYSFFRPSDHALTAQIRADSPELASSIFRLCATHGYVVKLPGFLQRHELEVVYFNPRTIERFFQAVMEQTD